MDRLSDRKIVLVTRRTRLDGLIARFNTEGQARFYVEHLGDSFDDYRLEHDNYALAVRECTMILARFGRVQALDRDFLPSYIFGPEDLVVVLGQDGLVANTLKYLDGHPVVGVNPDPARWDGVLLPFEVCDLARMMPDLIADRRGWREITMARVDLNTGSAMYAVNDFFIGPKTHVSARYLIEADGRREAQSSSGIIVSTGLGSTGWYKSLIAGALGLSAAVGANDMRTTRQRKSLDPSRLPGSRRITKRSQQQRDPLERAEFPWEADFLRFTVREPFPSGTSGIELVTGEVSPEQPLRVVSRMAGEGVIFSDGIERDFLEFNSGTEALVSVAQRKGRVVQ